MRRAKGSAYEKPLKPGKFRILDLPTWLLSPCCTITKAPVYGFIATKKIVALLSDVSITDTGTTALYLELNARSQLTRVSIGRFNLIEGKKKKKQHLDAAVLNMTNGDSVFEDVTIGFEDVPKLSFGVVVDVPAGSARRGPGLVRRIRDLKLRGLEGHTVAKVACDPTKIAVNGKSLPTKNDVVKEVMANASVLP